MTFMFLSEVQQNIALQEAAQEATPFVFGQGQGHPRDIPSLVPCNSFSCLSTVSIPWQL